MQVKRGLGRKLAASLQQAFYLVLSAGPILLGLSAFWAPSHSESYGWLLGFLAYPLFGTAIRMMLGRVKRLTPLLIGWLLSLGFGIALYGITFLGILSAISGLFLVSLGVRLAETTQRERMAEHILPAGLFLYLPGGWIFAQEPRFVPYINDLKVMGVLLLFAVLFQTSLDNIRFLALSGERHSAPPRSMVAANRKIAALFGVILVLISFWGRLNQALAALLQLVRQAILQSTRFLMGLFPDSKSAPEPAPGPQTPLQPLPAGDPSPFWVWMERIVYVIVAAAIAAALFYVLALAVKRFLPFVRRLMAWLLSSRSSLQEEEAYVDEVSSTRKRRNVRQGSGLRKLLGLSSNHRERYEDLLTNRQRVRYVYAAAIRKAEKEGWNRPFHLTPGELAAATREGRGPVWLDRETAAFYESVRYGSKEPSEEETKVWKERLSQRQENSR